MSRSKFNGFTGRFCLGLLLTIATGCGKQYFSALPQNGSSVNLAQLQNLAANLKAKGSTGSGTETGTASPNPVPGATGSSGPAKSGDGTEETPTVTASPSPIPSKLVCNSAASCSCGNNSIYICHVPPGNPAEKHTLCVGLPGALNGHGITFDGKPGGHGGDYPGVCDSDKDSVE
jgi:hypothetical protein